MDIKEAVTREDVLVWIEEQEGMRDLPPFMKASLATMFGELEIRRRLSENQLHAFTVESPAAAADLFRGLGHEMAPRRAAWVDLIFTVKAEATASGPLAIPAGDLAAYTAPGPLARRKFEAREGITILQGNTTFQIRAYDQETREATTLNTRTSGKDLQEVELPYLDIIPESVSLLIGGEEWIAVASLSRSNSTDRHVIFAADSAGRSRVVFGFTDIDGDRYGRVPAADQIITLSCATGGGSEGNVESNTITEYAGESQDIVSVSNPLKARYGRPAETIANARRMAPIRARTHDMFWDIQSGEALAREIPGVLAATINREASNRFAVSVLPTGGGVTGQDVLDAVYVKLVDASPMEQYDIFVSSAPLLNQAFTGTIHMQPGAQFEPARRLAALATAIRTHEASFDLMEAYSAGGLEAAVAWINGAFASLLSDVFTLEKDGGDISRILESIPHTQKAGEPLNPSDITAIIMVAVPGVNYVTMANPSNRVTPAPGAYVHPSIISFEVGN